MKNPFIVGDQVYTAGNLEPWKVREVGEGTVLLGSCPVPVSVEQLSFKPWPAPCHERPVEDGWWLCSYDDGLVTLRQKRGSEMYDSAGSRISSKVDSYTFHRYLGKDWK